MPAFDSIVAEFMASGGLQVSGKIGAILGARVGGMRAEASLSAYGSVRWLKVWHGGGCNFSATERAHKRNGDQIDAEWRLPSLVTTLQNSKVFGMALQSNDQFFESQFLCRCKRSRIRLIETHLFFLGGVQET